MAVDATETELGRVKVRASQAQLGQLLAFAEPFATRTWAIESAAGLGYLLAQQLAGGGEAAVDVPATLAARVRTLASGRSDKNDPNDALPVAVAALRAPALRPVQAANHSELLRLLATRNVELGSQRTRLVARLHAHMCQLSPGGIAKELYASDAEAFLAAVKPLSPAERARFDLALGLVEDLKRIDAQLQDSHGRIQAAVKVTYRSDRQQQPECGADGAGHADPQPAD